MKKALVVAGGLVALYLAVSHGTQSGTLINDAFTGGGNLVKTFQGR
jgi:hypothetical protein